MARETVALNDVRDVADDELIARLRRLVRADQALSTRLLVHVGEVDARGLYREHAYASMFTYCVEELRMSEAQAYLRIQAARLSRQFPRVLQLLAEGKLHLTAIKLLGPHLTAENHERVLEQASCKGKREIELLVAAIAPKPDVPTRVRKLAEPSSSRATRPPQQFAQPRVEASQPAFALAGAVNSSPVDATQALLTPPANHSVPSRVAPKWGVARSSRAPIDAPRDAACDPSQTPFADSSVATPSPTAIDAPVAGAGDPSQAAVPDSSGAVPTLIATDAQRDAACHPSRARFALAAPRQRGSCKPLSPGRYKMEFTAGQTLHDKLTQLKDLLRHQVPDGDLAVIVERAVDLLIEDTMKQRFAQTRAPKKPRAVEKRRSAKRRGPKSANSRYIPRAVVREVHQRDAGQCTFVSSNGTRCAERGFLELHHHDRPYAKGGEATVENLRLVCRAHNALFAERDYGQSFMRSKQMRAREAIDEFGPERVQI